jgi:hypothetical protein
MHRTFLNAAFIFLIFPSLAAAAYTPGETLDPNCLPSDPTCLVVNTTVTTGTINATSTTATSTFAGGFSVGSSTPWFSIDANTGWISLGKSTARAPLDFYNENDPGNGPNNGSGILFTGGVVQMDGLMDMTAGAHASCTGGNCLNGGGPLARGEGSSWQSVPNGASLTVDIGTAKSIAAITWGTYWKDSLPSQFTAYTIDYSTDGTTWTNLVTVTSGIKSTVLHYISPTISMRYVRITNTGAADAYISNVQILGYVTQNPYSDQPIGFVQTNWSGVSFGSGTTNAVLRTTGAFGIGTSTMSDRLTVDSGSGGAKAAMFQNSAVAATSTTALASFGALDSAGVMRKTASVGGAITQLNTAAYQGALVFYTANNATPAERARIDATGNFGIGTTTPWARLSVSAAANSSIPQFVVASTTAVSFIVDQSGKVGIGTTSPNYPLEIVSPTASMSLTGTGIKGLNWTDPSNGIIWQFSQRQAGDDTFQLWNNNGASWSRNAIISPSLWQFDTNVFFVGNVGIGNASPSYKLDVTGNGHFTSLVDAANFVATSSTATSTFAGSGVFGNATGRPYFDFVAPGNADGLRLYSLGNPTGGSVNPPSIGFYRSIGTPAYSANPRFRIVGNANGSDYDGFMFTSPSSAGTWMSGDINSGNSLSIGLVSDTANVITINQRPYVTAGTLVIGLDASASTPAQGGTIRSGQKNQAVTDIGGSNLTVEAGGGTGAGTPGDILLTTANVQSSGTTIQPYSTKMTLKANGNVGIGTSSPTAQLSTTGTVRFSNFGAGTLQTDANGNLSVSSDERLKNMQGSFKRGLTEIELINPILYQWKPETGYDTSSTYAGFSAQNVQAAIPEAVGQDGHGYLTLQDRPLIAAAVNAIKSLAGISEDFRVHLTAWLGDASNGIPTIFAGVGNFGTTNAETTNSKTTNTETLCVDGQCLTKSDVHALLQMLQQQNGIGGSPPVGAPSEAGTSTNSEGTSTPAIPDSPVDASSTSSAAL